MKVQIFCDGSYFINNSKQHCHDNKLKLNLTKLPSLLVETLSAKMKIPLIYTSTIFTASIPSNVSPKDKLALNKQKNFFDVLRNKCGYTVELFEIDFKGKRILKQDRGNDTWEPKEKCVDIAVASNLLFYKDSYDVGILITGDRDFLPAINKARELGKQIVIASFLNSCSREFKDVIYLDNLLPYMILDAPEIL